MDWIKLDDFGDDFGSDLSGDDFGLQVEQMSQVFLEFEWMTAVTFFHLQLMFHYWIEEMISSDIILDDLLIIH